MENEGFKELVCEDERCFGPCWGCNKVLQILVKGDSESSSRPPPACPPAGPGSSGRRRCSSSALCWDSTALAQASGN